MPADRASRPGQRWGLVVGARADLLLLDARASALLGLPDAHVLDALVFASDGLGIEAVWVAGRQLAREGTHQQRERIGQAFAGVMAQLWG